MRADTDPVPVVREDADDLVGRLRRRRSADHVAAAYSAAHGHPVTADDGGSGLRWVLAGRPALVAVVAVLLLAVVAGVVAYGAGLPEGVDAIGAAGRHADAGDGSAPGADGTGGSAAPEGSGGGSATGWPPAGAVPDRSPGSGPSGAVPATSAGAGVVAHVVGEVREPGLVELPAGARVAEAVEAAGGPTDDADLSGVNLARPVSDGEQISVPKPGQAADGTAPDESVSPPGPGGTSGTGIDINTADAAALETLPGIGPSLAAAVVEWRAANGPFASVDELEDVPGIGPLTLEEIRAALDPGSAPVTPP